MLVLAIRRWPSSGRRALSPEHILEWFAEWSRTRGPKEAGREDKWRRSGGLKVMERRSSSGGPSLRKCEPVGDIQVWVVHSHVVERSRVGSIDSWCSWHACKCWGTRECDTRLFSSVAGRSSIDPLPASQDFTSLGYKTGQSVSVTVVLEAFGGCRGYWERGETVLADLPTDTNISCNDSDDIRSLLQALLPKWNSRPCSSSLWHSQSLSESISRAVELQVRVQLRIRAPISFTTGRSFFFSFFFSSCRYL